MLLERQRQVVLPPRPEDPSSHSHVSRHTPRRVTRMPPKSLRCLAVTVSDRGSPEVWLHGSG